MKNIQELLTSFQKQSRDISFEISENNLGLAKEKIELLNSWAKANLQNIPYADIKNK